MAEEKPREMEEEEQKVRTSEKTEEEGEEEEEKGIEKSVSFKEESSKVREVKEEEKKGLEDLRRRLRESMKKEDEEEEGVRVWGVDLRLEEEEEEREGATDVILLKFLRAREMRVEEAEEMLKKTVKWRGEKRIEGIVEEEIEGWEEMKKVCYISGRSREGRPVCYSVHGGEIYRQTMESQEKKERLLRWRIQRVEEGIRMLDFSPAGVSSFLLINDLNDTPASASSAISNKDLRFSIKHSLDLLHHHYPDLVSTNIFINVPFWYYAIAALQSQFLTQRSRSKLVFARPARVTDTLLKYIGGEEIPVQYGGLKREEDCEFGVEDKALEVVVKSGGTHVIHIPTPEVGSRAVWDVGVVGWDVKYKEEFVPTEQGSYAVIIQRERKVGSEETAVRNSFVNKEAGKVVLVIESGMFKKKRVLFRYKVTPPPASQ